MRKLETFERKTIPILERKHKEIADELFDLHTKKLQITRNYGIQFEQDDYDISDLTPGSKTPHLPLNDMDFTQRTMIQPVINRIPGHEH